MKICMLGIGSIGIQHMRNLEQILREYKIDFQIDALRMQGKPIPDDVQKLISEVYASFEALPSDYDILFINTPTSMHFEHLSLAINNTKHIFLEKPVFDNTTYRWNDLPQKHGSVYYVACPLRYNSVIERLKEIVQSEHVLSVRCICSSYLPDWRPGIDYRTCYSAKAAQGGGVRTDLIHEWDYINYLFGAPNDIQQYHGTYSNLEITSEDIAVYIARYTDKLISLHLDYFGRENRREIELYTAEEVIIGDLNNHTIRFLRQGCTTSIPQSRVEMQISELKAFFDMTNGKIQNHNTIENAVGTLKIALGD